MTTMMPDGGGERLSTLDEEELRSRYAGYVEDFREEDFDAEPCSFQDWLRGEIADGLIIDDTNN